MVKPIKNLLRNQRADFHVTWYLGMYYPGLQPVIVCSNDDPEVTLTYFTARSNLGFSMGKSENSGFLETIAASDPKVGRCKQIIEFMKVCEY